jgi:phospholipid-translocating ATPase
MSNLIDLKRSTNTSAFNKIIKKNNDVGLQSFIFTKKKITKEDAEKFVDSYKSIIQTSLDIESDLSALADKMENDLEFVAVLGLKNTLREDALYTVDKFKSMGVKVHMLTGDLRDNAVYTATSLKLIAEGGKTITYLDFIDADDGKVKIKEILEKIRNSGELKKRGASRAQSSVEGGLERLKTMSLDTTLKPNNSNAMTFVVSGRTMEIAKEDSYLENHLAFILQYAVCIVGYEMKPNHKKEVLMTMKRCNQGGMIMAIGDGYNDIPMLEFANIGVQLALEQSHLSYGDIMVKDLALIPELMINDGSKFNSNLNLAVAGSFYNSMSIGSLLFFFQFYCGFTASAIIQSGLIYATYAGYSAVALFFIAYENMYPAKTRNDLPALYREHLYRNKLMLSSFFFLVVFH